MNQWTENLITVEQAKTLDGLFLERIRRSPEKTAYRSFYRHSKSWRDYSWREMASSVGQWQEAIKKEPLAVGDRVALILRNCPEWVVFDQASLGSGLVVVPLYTDDRPDNIAAASARSWQTHLFETSEGLADRLIAEGLLSATDLPQ